MRHKKGIKAILSVIILVAVVMGIGFGLYQIPEIQTKVDHEVVAWQIEKKLQEKYGIEFDVIADQIENGNQIERYSVYYPSYEDAAYTFYAEFGEETYPDVWGDPKRYYIVGIVNDEMQLLADSYPYYLYREELMNTLEEMVNKDLGGNVAAIPRMSAGRVVTLDEDAENFERFYENTHTYDPIYLFVDENCSDAELEAAYQSLMEKQFPFTVCFKKIPGEEITVLKESGVDSLVYENDEIESQMDALHGTDSYWEYEVLKQYEMIYFWYKATGDSLYNADLYDEITKGR